MFEKWIVIDQMGKIRSEPSDRASIELHAKFLDRAFRTGLGCHEAYPLKAYRQVMRRDNFAEKGQRECRK